MVKHKARGEYLGGGTTHSYYECGCEVYKGTVEDIPYIKVINGECNKHPSEKLYGTKCRDHWTWNTDHVNVF